MNSWFSKILAEYNEKRNTRAFYATKSFKKLWNYVGDLSRKESFKKYIKDLRLKYSIPEDGFIIETSTWDAIPKSWIHCENMTIVAEIKNELNHFCAEHQLSPQDWEDIFEGYLFYNKLFLSLEPNSHNLLFVGDMTKGVDSRGIQISDDILKTFPTALLIHPNASKRDILDYIERLYKTEIEPSQKKYRSADASIGKQRTRINIKRDDIIFANQHLPMKEIRSLLGARGIYLDDGSIGKILSIERKRRS